jgi:DEAD/DEAH box helicase domain-containing protein
MNIVYFDLETRRSANDVDGWNNKGRMGISVAVTYSTARGTYQIYEEHEADALVNELLKADLVVGYNILNFDYEVLMAHTVHDLRYAVRTLDLLVDVEAAAGFRPGLDSIAKPTLGLSKTAQGIDAVRWFREGRLEEIATYCCYDVKVTRLVHEYGVRNKTLFAMDRNGRKHSVALSWRLENTPTSGA